MLRAVAHSKKHDVAHERAAVHTPGAPPWAALLLGLFLVVSVAAAAISTAAWAGSSIRLQAASEEVVGQWARHEPEHRLVGAMPGATSYCPPGQARTFRNEFAALSRAIGNAIGQPIECAHVDPASGDVLQATSTGLAVYRVASRVASFTDGYRHWAVGGRGLISWEGESVDAPE